VFDAQADVLWDTQYGFGSQDAIAQAAQARRAIHLSLSRQSKPARIAPQEAMSTQFLAKVEVS
jgi:hypothetical protein